MKWQNAISRKTLGNPSIPKTTNIVPRFAISSSTAVESDVALTTRRCKVVRQAGGGGSTVRFVTLGAGRGQRFNLCLDQECEGFFAVGSNHRKVNTQHWLVWIVSTSTQRSIEGCGVDSLGPST